MFKPSFHTYPTYFRRMSCNHRTQIKIKKDEVGEMKFKQNSYEVV